MTGIITEIVALSPGSVEEPRDSSAPISPSSLLPKAGITLAPGIPTERVPEYSVDQFNYVSTQGGVKQWNLIADKANMYNQEKLVHARQVKALLYDPDGKITTVTGQEAKFLMNKRDLEIYGNVKTVMPDGFEIHSQYMRYLPNERLINIPPTEPVDGVGKDESGQVLAFNSYGMHYAMEKSEIILPSRVQMVVDKPESAPKSVQTSTDSPPPSSKTKVESDHCVIYRDRKLAHFTMNAGRSLSTRFVKVTQPTLFSKGRTADVNYGDLGGPPGKNKLLNYLILHDDVLIEEKTADGSMRYGTGGQADFDAVRNLVVLRHFPQVYQNHDTVTGDVIVLHRDTDVVEIEHSNAFSEGEESPAAQ
ncbi:MAG: LPS export ABC transporter periplasmic protein LptC [Oligoflexia bacterium]|nr:LPS export ABC transporter periplasmic protein LptC [Oligoflexia bacterium]